MDNRNFRKNKKGLEAPKVIVYVLYTSLIILFGLVLIRSFASDLCTTSTDRAFNLDFNALASRAVYSHNCFAIQQSYRDIDGTHHYVDAGTLNASLISTERLKSCIAEGGDYEIGVKYASDTYLIGEDSCEGSWDRKENFLVRIQNESGIYNGLVTFCLSADAERYRSERCRE